MKKILIVEDELPIAELEKDYLELSDFEVTIETDGIEGEAKAMSGEYDLLILDVMLPGQDGFEICRKYREKYLAPVIVVSAKKEDIDKIHGLGLGADDYMTKPFNSLELVVRVKALLRRAYYFNQSNDNQVIKIGALTIDKYKHRVCIDEEEISFTSREFEILYLLANNRGRVFSTEEIFEKVWKERYYQSNNTVMVHMSRIREKIEKKLDGEKIIHTIRGVGYKIER